MKSILLVVLMLCAVPVMGQPAEDAPGFLPPVEFIAGVGGLSAAPLGHLDAITTDGLFTYAWGELTLPVLSNVYVKARFEQVMQRDDYLKRPDPTARLEVGYRLF